MKEKREASLGILERIENDKEMSALWEKFTAEKKRELREIDAGIRVPHFLGDTMFKGLFDPDREKERLSSLISSILGRRVKVLHSLRNEGTMRSEYSKRMILDIAVRFEDGSVGNVEIQRYGVYFPSNRAVAYSADMVARQYAALEGRKKSDVNYGDINPVYFIIIMEESMPEFGSFSEYRHHFEQKSDTGARLEMLQYYDFICLDKFKEQHPSEGGELERWLTFLSITETAEMERFLEENQDFQSVYDCAILMMKDGKELMNMMEDIFANEDIVASLEKTYATLAKKNKLPLGYQYTQMQEKVQKMEQQMKEKEQQIDDLTKEIVRLQLLLDKKSI